MRFASLLALIITAAVNAPAAALTANPPPSPAFNQSARFADPDAALEQAGSALRDGFVNNALGVRGGAVPSEAWGSAALFSGPTGDGGGVIPLRSLSVTDTGRSTSAKTAVSAAPQ